MRAANLKPTKTRLASGQSAVAYREISAIFDGMTLSEIMAEKGHRWESLQRRFWIKVDKRTPTECWNWTACLSTTGYGRMSSGRGVIIKAPRIAFAIAHGSIVDDLCVLHHCDNPRCCNPAHLFQGTKAENMSDKMRKGRGTPPPHSYGAAHHNAKFNSATSEAIRHDTRPAHVIALEYGVCTQTIYRHRRGETWNKTPPNR